MEANATLDLKEMEFEPEYVMEVIYEDAEDREQVREILFSVDKNGGNFCVKNVSEYVYRYREKEMKKLLKVCESIAFLLY